MAAPLKKLIIDGIEIEVDGAMTIIQAAEVAGVEIPRFCYHERLTIAGNYVYFGTQEGTGGLYKNGGSAKDNYRKIV